MGYFGVDGQQKKYKIKLMNEDQSRIDERAEQLVESHALLLEELLALRKKHGFSQDLVGERMGISQPAVASFESHDSNPTLSSIRRYALAIGARIEHKVIDDLEIIAKAETGIRQAEQWLVMPRQQTSYKLVASRMTVHAQ